MIEIQTVSNPEQANAITHAGVFHADEVMAAAILTKFRRISVYRCFSLPNPLSGDTIAFDIGCGTYDHHQKGGNGCRDNGIPFAACGLVWRDYGAQALQGHCMAEEVNSVLGAVDRALMQGIDAADNGYPLCAVPACIQTVSKILSAFNPTWDDEKDSDTAFLDAVQMARIILDNEIQTAVSAVRARGIVEDAIHNSVNHIMILPRFVPWKETVLEQDTNGTIWYTVFPTKRGDYSCQCVPQTENEFSQRHPTPSHWHGLSGSALREACGVDDALFCHASGFMMTAASLSGAVAMAELAVHNAEPL